MVVVSSLGLVACLLKMVGQVGIFLFFIIVITCASSDMKKGQFHSNCFWEKNQNLKISTGGGGEAERG